jgi:hypothetical protein
MSDQTARGVRTAPAPAQKVDPFKPADPNLPGVSARVTAPQPAPRARSFPPKVAIALVAALALGAAGTWWLIGPARTSARHAPVELAALALAAEAEVLEPPAPPIPLAPGPVATVEEMREPWATKLFYFRGLVEDEKIPAALVRLPGERGGYWAFAVTEPFGRCQLELVADRERLAREFGYRAQHLMVADPCNGSVYHPLRWGVLPSGAVARGEVVAGPAIRPPLAIQIAVRGGEIHALRIEP